MQRDKYQANSQRSRSFGKLIPFLVFLAIVFLIAREEIPAVGDAWERMVAPDNWLAKQTCQQAAIERSEHKEFSRLLKPGKANKTTDGMYIDRLVVGEMGRAGDEVSVEYTCYVDSEGKLVKLNRIEDSK